MADEAHKWVYVANATCSEKLGSQDRAECISCQSLSLSLGFLLTKVEHRSNHNNPGTATLYVFIKTINNSGYKQGILQRDF